MDKMQALDSFWGGFGLMAYDQNTVPDDAALPYITYEAASDDFGNSVQLNASIWYRSASWAGASRMEEHIAKSIGRGGVMIPFEGGAMWIRKGTPWAQRMSDPNDDMIRRVVLQITAEFLD